MRRRKPSGQKKLSWFEGELPLGKLLERLRCQDRRPATCSVQGHICKEWAHPRNLTADREVLAVSAIKRYSDRGLPLSKGGVADAVALIAEQMPVEGKLALQFKDERPARKFLTGFCRRSKQEIRFGAASKQSADRMAATTAENIARAWLR